MQTADKAATLRSVPWRLSYRTSALKPDGQPVDILHDFYLPALRRAVRYDRVAGYFRSSSLAAASQGFSAFVGRQGSMRLIVGADLEPQDVQAILNGEEEHLSAMLSAALARPETWPETVTRGVALLAWMVAHGYLDVRVAFRVHAQTGEPLPATSVVDGYVHMKWAVLADADGNRLYMSGSLNESHAALVMNAENIDVHCDWYGDPDRQRIEEAEREFQRLWDDQHPSLRVLTLPEAVRRRLLSLAAGVTQPVEIDGSSATSHTVPPPSALERLRFALLRDGPRLPGGHYVGMETAPVAPWPHQSVVARRLIDTWPYSYLLCDEVGLGKTIEAGLAIRSLVLSGLVQRVLIGAPASLTGQWQREMADKFFLPFARALGGAHPQHEYLLPHPTQRQAASLYAPDLLIISTGLLTRQERQAALQTAQPFDLTLIDEAHYARRQNPHEGSKAHPQYGQLYQTLMQTLRPKSRSLLLATATPMQIDPVEVADLLQLTNRVGAFQYDPSLMGTYYEAMGKLAQGLAIGDQEWAFLRRAVLAVRDQDPPFWAFLEQAVIDGRIRLAVRQWLEQERRPRRPDMPGVLRLIFAAAPLSRVMLRHTRSLLELYRDDGRLGANLAQRHILPIPRITFTEQERQAYDQLETYCKGLAAQMAGQSNLRTRAAVGFLMSFLRLRFASSLFAIHETLRRRMQRVRAALDFLELESSPEPVDNDGDDRLDTDDDDDTAAVQTLLRHRSPADLYWEHDQLQAMLTTLADLSGPSSKMRELFTVLHRRRLAGTERLRQTVIFTRFYDTLSDILHRLRRVAPTMLIGTYSGQGGQYVEAHTGALVTVARDVVKHLFLRQQIDILICTDAAAEGLNLQTADLLVNFDLPWNPMKVEQRIGRIDRIGQTHHDIDVLNLCYADSAEHIVYGRLLTRLSAIGAIVGTQQLSLLPVTPEEFAQLADKTLSEVELEQRATARAWQAHRRTATMEISPQDLYHTYLRLEQQQDTTPLPVSLDTLWDTLARSTYLCALGCRVLPEPGAQTMRLAGIPTVPDGTLITTSRTAYEEGVSFATYGNPIFDAILAHIETFSLPPCIHRLEMTMPGLPMPVVAYAVAQAAQNGTTACRLVSALRDLDTLQLDEKVKLTDAALEPLRHSLVTHLQTTMATTLAAPHIEARNEAAGRSQKLFALFVLRGIIASRQRTSSAEPLFWREIAALEELFQSPDYTLRVRRIPSAQARTLTHLLFDLTIPRTGEESHLDAPRPLLLASVEAAYRLADGMRARRAALSTEDFLARLERELARMIS